MRNTDILKVYKIQKEDAEQRLVKKQAKCQHIHWAARCSCCKKVLDSDVRDLKRKKSVISKEVQIA